MKRQHTYRPHISKSRNYECDQERIIACVKEINLKYKVNISTITVRFYFMEKDNADYKICDINKFRINYSANFYCQTNAS